MQNGMWTKGLVFGIVMLFVGISVFPCISGNIRNVVLNQEWEKTIIFTTPTTIVNGSYNMVKVEEATSYLMEYGKPILPTHIENIILPYGVKITDICCTIGNIQSMTIPIKIKPAPKPIPKSMIYSQSTNDTDIYDIKDFYPENWYSYNLAVGLDKNNNHKTILTINTYPVRYNPSINSVEYIESINIKIKYDDPVLDPFPETSTYDLVIIAPPVFISDLQSLVEHKNSYGVKTITKTTEEIYTQYTGVDNPEKIKYFIKNAVETWGVKYILFVGGLKSRVWADPRENINYGDQDWYVPVRYSNLDDGSEPGFISDLYYADLYKEGGVFDNWDSNGDGIFAYKKLFSTKNDNLDLYPDVYLGRLSCRNNDEVKCLVDKIINYESTSADPSWFKKIMVVAGDTFLDQEDLNFKWDTNGLPAGSYTIYAQSTNPEGISGPVDETLVTLDKTQNTKLTFNHDDYLLFPNFPRYPSLPIAKIMSISNGDVIGKDNYFYKPGEGEAYCNDDTGYANVQYTNGILYLRGKTYDPQPYGNLSTIKIWVENSQGQKVFEDTRINFEMYYEGEWSTGDRILHDRAGALYYLPSDFQKEILWTSNGGLCSQSDVINTQSEGSGFTFFSGHGSPMSWATYYPGVPGNIWRGVMRGLQVIDYSTDPPNFPMEKFSNDYQNPIVVVNACHNSRFNVSLIPGFIAECWSEWYMRVSKRGAIACIGNTGYGYGYLGEWCTSGLGDWICIEFFKQYDVNDIDILGLAYANSISEYLNQFRVSHDIIDEKTVQQWVLLGDPSLKIGGYPGMMDLRIIVNGSGDADGIPGSVINLQAIASQQPKMYSWDLDADGKYDDATGEIIQDKWDKPGAYRVSVKATYDNVEKNWTTIVDIIKDKTPITPSIISGPSKGKTNKTYSYSTSTSDPYGDDLYYVFYWDLFTDSNHETEISVVGPIKSGEVASVKHKFTSKGVYYMSVQVFDCYGLCSDRSEITQINISKNKESVSFYEILENLCLKFQNMCKYNFKPLLNQKVLDRILNKKELD